LLRVLYLDKKDENKQLNKGKQDISKICCVDIFVIKSGFDPENIS